MWNKLWIITSISYYFRLSKQILLWNKIDSSTFAIWNILTKVNEPDDEVLTDAVKDDTVDVFPADVDGSETDDTGMLESGCSET